MLPRLGIRNHVAYASQCAQFVKSDHPLRQHFRCRRRHLSFDLRTTGLHCRKGHHRMSAPRPEPRRQRRKQLHAPIGGDFDISLQDVHGGFSFINRRLASGHYFEVHPRAGPPSSPWSPLRPGVSAGRRGECSCRGCRRSRGSASGSLLRGRHQKYRPLPGCGLLVGEIEA